MKCCLQQSLQVCVHVVLLHQLFDQDEILPSFRQEVVLNIDEDQRRPFFLELNFGRVMCKDGHFVSSPKNLKIH